MNYFILISGKSQVGKDTLADFFISHIRENEDYDIEPEKIGFANNIKRVAKENFGWDGKKDEKGVNLLIDIGEIGRKYNQNIWVNNLLEKCFTSNCKKQFLYIIKDWRFFNEYQRIYEKFPLSLIYKIRINGSSKNKNIFINQNASTENELDNQSYLMDYIIENNENTNLENFFNQGKLIIEDIINKIIKGSSNGIL